MRKNIIERWIYYEESKSILYRLQDDPYSLPNIKPIKGSDYEDYRYRFGDFRLMYRIINGELIILILDIGPRGDIYK
jgi:mRNA interferase RelE/StbE